MSDIHVNIKKRREELGMSQEELARKVGYTSRSTIARIERGDIVIPSDKIEPFAKALNMLPEYLMGWADDEGITMSDVDFIEDDRLRVIIERANKDTAYRERLLKIAELLED